MYLMSEFEKLKTGLDDRKVKRMQLSLVVRLAAKLNERQVEDSELARMFEELLKTAVDYAEGREPIFRYYSKQKSILTNYVLKTHGLAYKGYYTAMYMSFGIIFGSALGIIFMTSMNPAFYALGIGPGIAIGVSLGAAKEGKAEKEGKIY